MKRMVVLGLLLAACAPQAVPDDTALPAAPAEVVSTSGTWGNTSGCERVAGGTPATDKVFVLRPDRIETWESVCRITGDTSSADGARLVATTCEGEGETWEQEFSVEPQHGGDRLTVRFSGESNGGVHTLRLCQ